MDFDSTTYRWREVSNTWILDALKTTKQEMERTNLKNRYCNKKTAIFFEYNVKPDKLFSREGKIILKTNIEKEDVIILLGNIFSGKLKLSW